MFQRDLLEATILLESGIGLDEPPSRGVSQLPEGLDGGKALKEAKERLQG